MYKYDRTIKDGAEKLIDGIENLEMFLEDNERFHDCGIYSFCWDNESGDLIITVEALTHRFFAGEYGNMLPLLDFHFEHPIEVKMDMDPGIAIIDEMEISKSKYNEFLVCEFGQVCISITSHRLRVDKPRFVPLKDDEPEQNDNTI